MMSLPTPGRYLPLPLVLLLLAWAGPGCAGSGAPLQSDAQPANRVYAAGLNEAVQGVQDAITRTQSEVTGYEETPQGYVIFGRMSNAYARAGAQRNPELLEFEVRVSSAGIGQTRVHLQMGQPSTYGARAGSEFVQAFFSAFEGEGFQRMP